MIRTDRWKYVHFKHFPPQLFDLENDPDEFNDLGRDSSFEDVRQMMHQRLVDRLLNRKNRVTMRDEAVENVRNQEDASGILIGRWS